MIENLHGVIDESVGHQKEIGDDGCDHIQIPDRNETGSNDQCQQVPIPRLTTATISLGKDLNPREDFVLGHGLKDLGCTDQRGES